MADSSSSTFATMADDCNFETTLVPYPDPRLSELSETGNKFNHTPEQPRNSSSFDLKTDVFREVSHIKSDSFVNNCSDVASQKADYRNFVIQQELEGEEKVEVAGDAAVSLDDSVLEKKEEQDSNEEEKVEMAGDAATGLNDIIPEKQEKQGFEEEEEVEKACPATTCSNANVLKKQESASAGAADGLNDTDLRKQEPKPEITGDLNGIVLEKREKGFSGVKERLEFEKNGIFLEQREKSLCGEKESLELDNNMNVKYSLKFEVIDETALVETSEIGGGFGKESKMEDFGKNVNNKRNVGQEERRRRRGKGGKNKHLGADEKEKDFDLGLTHNCEIGSLRGSDERGEKRVYTTKELEALRFVELEGQKKIWAEVYCGLGPAVQKEYDVLLGCNNQNQCHHQQPKKHLRVNFNHRFRNEALPSILGECVI